MWKAVGESVAKYTKLFDFPPLPIKGIESIDPKRHAPTILGLVSLPAYKHWTLLDALNVVALMDLKWRDPLTEARNATKGEIDAVVAEAQQVYAHFGETPPAPYKLRAAMITRLSNFSPTKKDMAKVVRSDGTMGGIASDALDQTLRAQPQQGHAEKIAALNESNKRARREEGDEFRNKTNKSHRDHHRRKSAYRQIDEVNAQLKTGGAFMSDAEIEELVEHHCSVVHWPQLGGRTVDEAMALPDFSQHTGITKQTPLSLEALNFLIRGVGRDKKAREKVPPITHPDGSYINVPDATAMGFFCFRVFRSNSMFDCKRFETKMQKRYEHLPFITKILKKEGSLSATTNCHGNATATSTKNSSCTVRTDDRQLVRESKTQ
jgi:hypothetical protein